MSRTPSPPCSFSSGSVVTFFCRTHTRFAISRPRCSAPPPTSSLQVNRLLYISRLSYSVLLLCTPLIFPLVYIVHRASAFVRLYVPHSPSWCHCLSFFFFLASLKTLRAYAATYDRLPVRAVLVLAQIQDDFGNPPFVSLTAFLSLEHGFPLRDLLIYSVLF